MRRSFLASLFALSLAACASQQPAPSTRAAAQRPVFAPRAFDGSGDQPWQDVVITDGCYHPPERCPIITDIQPRTGETTPQHIQRLLDASGRNFRECQPSSPTGVHYLFEIARLATRDHICNEATSVATFAFTNLRTLTHAMLPPPITATNINHALQLLFDTCGPTGGGRR